jgi:hypothetical protein
MKIDNIFHKPIIEILYILTNMYDKVYITKPTIVTNITNERFIVCKNFILNPQTIITYNNNMNLLINILKNNINNNNTITSLLKNTIPYFFINKIAMANIPWLFY